MDLYLHSRIRLYGVVLSLKKKLLEESLPFMEPEGSLPCSLAPSKHKPTDLCK
jgi:hypothetical protein